MVARFTALQLFNAYNFGRKFKKSANSHLTVSYNIPVSLYRDIKVAIYHRYTEIVYQYISTTCIAILTLLAFSIRVKPWMAEGKATG